MFSFARGGPPGGAGCASRPGTPVSISAQISLNGIEPPSQDLGLGRGVARGTSWAKLLLQWRGAWGVMAVPKHVRRLGQCGTASKAPIPQRPDFVASWYVVHGLALEALSQLCKQIMAGVRKNNTR